jgi:hypothetical protein
MRPCASTRAIMIVTSIAAASSSSVGRRNTAVGNEFDIVLNELVKRTQKEGQLHNAKVFDSGIQTGSCAGSSFCIRILCFLRAL